MRAPVTTRPANCLDRRVCGFGFWFQLATAAGVLFGYCWMVEAWF